jgi:hypothetical protein
MLKTIFENFGFVGSLILSLVIFLFSILWLAGIAGITQSKDGGKVRYKSWMVWLSVVVPIFPIAWIISQIWNQFTVMNTTKK